MPSAARMIERAERAHFLVEQADGIVLGVVGAKAVRADHLGEAVGLVRRGRVAAAAHFAEAHAQARLGELPSGFRAGEAAADDVDVEGHGGCIVSARKGGRYPAPKCASSPLATREPRSEFLSALQEAGVQRVIDVRALPLSRRPGFSKTPLRLALKEAGIDYVHLKALGTPSEGRSAPARGGTRTWSASMLVNSSFPKRWCVGGNAGARGGKTERVTVHRARPRALPSDIAPGNGRCGRRGRRPLRLA